jgi:uncharacterized protein (TIGR00159 family)
VERVIEILLPWYEALVVPMRWRDVVDITVMAFFVYQAYIYFRGTRAARIGVGLAIMGTLYFIAHAAGLLLTSWVLSGIWAAVFVLVIIVFQTEIRQLLEQVQPTVPSFSWFRRSQQQSELVETLRTIADACFTLAAKRRGVLLVFERRDKLEPLFRSPGVIVDARVSAQLLENLFMPPAPLHDGAVYIRGERIYRAGCVLPLSETHSLPHFYGTRHRAAVGLTERSDALAIVVSEERGAVSVVARGNMVTQPDAGALCAWLTARLTKATTAYRFVRPRLTVLTYNWRAKLASIAVVIGLWMVLVGPQNAEVGFSIPVIYDNIPVDLDITSSKTQEVYLRVRGPRELINLLDQRRLRANINLKEAQEGTTRYSLSARDVNIPLGVEVAGVDPTTVTVRLKKKPPPEKEETKVGAGKVSWLR